jgi:tetratricopeptide (TPR) repeat protein
MSWSRYPGRVGSGALLTAVLLATLGASTPEEKPGDWDTEPFLAKPSALLQAAAAAGDHRGEVTILLEEGRYAFDAQGRCDYRYHLVYRIETAAGASSWATVTADWSPWHESRPSLRARVIAESGESRDLDPATISEAGVGDDDEIFSDRRRLRAPLPAVKAGSVVEEVIQTPDTAPLFEAGVTYAFRLGGSVPVRRSRVIVEAPESLRLHYAVRGMEGVTVDRESAAGAIRLRVQVGPLEALAETEPWMPSDHPRYPYFALATGTSWASVAQAYNAVVDRQIATPLAEARSGIRREEVAARLLSQLHRDVRYTGVEFGEASLVPRAPAEVLSRRYGDCKDKSAFLVSRLRAEGVDAYVALLSAGPGADVDSDMPGLGSFDHAIVVLPGQETLWIDPTAEFSRVNELPLADQDRLTLIAAPTTTSLVRTPSTSSGDNVLSKTREYRLAESGPGSVTETTRTSGAVEQGYRSFYARTDARALREAQEKYAKAEHGADAIVSASHTDPGDLSTSFETSIDSKGAEHAVTDGLSASVTINPAGLFARLPDYVDADPDDGGAAAPRKQPFVLSEPHRVEWNYRVVPPPGFVVKHLPDSERAPLGTASVEVQFETRPGNFVEGRLAFDTGPRLMDPKAFDDLRSGVRQWRRRDPLQIEFEDEAQSLLDSGRTCEGLAELEKTQRAQPRRAKPHERLAEALLKGGFGEAARAEARRAVDLEPDSSSAHRVLGWTLEHDALGRRFKAGSDRAGADAEYRKAKALDPKDGVARASLAILHEHNDEGVHFGEGADLAEAVEEIESYRSDLKGTSLDTNLMLSLMGLDRFEDLETLARSLPETTERNEFILVAVAARRGPEAAIAQAARMIRDPVQRGDSLLHAGNSLIQRRRYLEGSALVAESAKGASEASVRRARADVFARVRRYEELSLPEDDPRSAVKRVFIAVAEQLAGAADSTALLDVIWASEGERLAFAHDPGSLRRGFVTAFRRAAGAGAAFTRGTVDLVLAVGDFVAEGDPDTGYRVRIRSGDRLQSTYVTKRDGRYKVLSMSDDPDVLAGEAWRLLDAGNAAGAAQWLDWAREGFEPTPDDDPLAGSPFLRLWRRDGPRGADACRVAAASLFTSGSRLPAAIQVLKVVRDATTEGQHREAIEIALMALDGRTGRTAEMLDIANRFSATYPSSETAFLARVGALTSLGRYAEAKAVCEERLRRIPGDIAALRNMANLAVIQGKYDEGDEIFARMVKLGRAERIDLNNRAWNSILRGRVDEAALKWAQEAAQGQRPEAASLHTLAAAYAESGHAKEAQQVLAQSIAARDDVPQSQDWYVVGRTAEECGLTSIALDAYGKVTAKTDRLDETAVLARRGMVRLGKGLPTSASR